MTSPTTRRSPCATLRSLRATQAIVAAEVGQLELAYDYLCEAALIDLDDIQHNTRDGLHIASLAGTWLGVVAGFGGMRDHDGVLSFAPRLPQALTHVAFRLMFRGRRLLVEIARSRAAYSLLEGDPLQIVHHGAKIRVTPGKALARRIPAVPKGKPPSNRKAGRRNGGGSRTDRACDARGVASRA